ncbi:hypothetical protein [Streptomyces sp. NBC_00310]|uniref:hypothetical protein n=1 Tax=Streptomyces sp. NBC_00310 TaxID=2903645 RepID=UPI002E200587
MAPDAGHGVGPAGPGRDDDAEEGDEGATGAEGLAGPEKGGRAEKGDEGDAYGEDDAYGEGDGGVGNSAWVEETLDALVVCDASGPPPPGSPSLWSNSRTSATSGPVGVAAAVAAVVTGMAIVDVGSGPGKGEPDPLGPVPPGPCSTRSCRVVRAASPPGVPGRRGLSRGPSFSSPSSTYGRIRRGSKSSAAAASAVRASRRASDARRPHAQDGVPSEARGVEHSGHM